MLQGLRDGFRAVLLEEGGTPDRPRAIARSVLQITLVLLLALLSTTVMDASVNFLPGDSGRWLMTLAAAAFYGSLYTRLLHAHTGSPVAWLSVAVFVCELLLLTCLFPYLLLVAHACTPKVVVDGLTGPNGDYFTTAIFLFLLLFSMKGWARFIHRSGHIQLASENAKLYERLAMEDPLTGLPNRRSFERDIAFALRDPGVRVALIMIDVDDFKRINDGFSHEVGDRVLQGIAAVLREAVGNRGVPARLAGDEFIVGLFGLEHNDESAMIGHIEVAMARYDWDRVAPRLTVTVSLGLARATEGDAVADLLRRGDEQMYKYKRRDRVDQGEPASTRN